MEWCDWSWWFADVVVRCVGVAFVARRWLAPWTWWLSRQALCWARYALTAPAGPAACGTCGGPDGRRSRRPRPSTCGCCGGVDFEGMVGRWAVVTGCTDGIGKEFALQLANQGLNVALISRNQNKLRAVAEEISRQNGDAVQTRIVVADFTSCHGTLSLAETYDGVRRGLDGLDVALLINNAGICYPSPDRLLDLPPCWTSDRSADGDPIRDVVECNVLGPVAMCRIVMPLMMDGGHAGLDDRNGWEEDGWEEEEEEDGDTLLLSTTPVPPPRPRPPLTRGGVVVNVSSASSQLPCPMLSVYGATKMFVAKFSTELAAEYGDQTTGSRGRGETRPPAQIDVRCLTTGFVATKMSRMRSAAKGFPWVPGPGLYARHSLRSLACHCGCRLLRKRRNGGRKNADGVTAAGASWLARAASAVFDSPSSPFTPGQIGTVTTGYITHTIMVYMTNIAILMIGEAYVSKLVCNLMTVGRNRINARDKKMKIAMEKQKVVDNQKTTVDTG